MLTRVVCSLLVCGLIGCGGSGARAPVEDRYARPAPSSSSYTVQGGETLYSIAFRYGLDFRKVAAANRIPAPYTIYPGQKIFLKEVAVARAAPAATKPAATRAPASKTPDPKPPPLASAAKTPAVKKPQPVVRVSTSALKKNSPTQGTGPGAGAVVKAWRWPASGRITRSYSSSVHKGIDIGGERGDAIYAVADGTVVYSGTGIVGFGELLIIKHNETYLSAYGHNDRLLVAEGENVRAGQKIAEKGSSGTDTVKLHFEIRKEGKPVDPKRLLPRR